VRVDVVIPALASRDAIGVHTMAISELLRENDIDSDVFYGECFSPELAHLARPVVDLGRVARGAGKDRWLLYQSSIGSPVFEVLAARSEPKLVNYHNITPASLIEAWEPKAGYEVELGRAQLRRLADQTVSAIADSRYNEVELCKVGYRRTEVVPLLIETGSTGEPADPSTTERLARDKSLGAVDLLFVGKVSPHKAPHDLIKMLAVLRQVYEPRARLHIVGGALGEGYPAALRGFVHRLGLDDAVSFPGSVTPGQLESYLTGCDVFVCASDHEGFCVPIIEAMGHGMPVVAYAATAVPETVADAGLLLGDKDPVRFAAAVARVLDDPELRHRLTAAGRRRAECFNLERTRTRMLGAIRGAVATTGR
jgi:L-malate glycosyltransferase